MKRTSILVICVVPLLGVMPPGITGTWRGTFNGQPVDLKPDGSYPETVTRFELSISIDGGKSKGLLVVLGHPNLKAPITNVQCDRMSCGFEVIDNSDGEIYTWRIEPHGSKLRGNRNCGHMTPLGIGAGARIFAVRAERISK